MIWRDIVCWFSACRFSGLDRGDRSGEINRLSELDAGNHLSSMYSPHFCRGRPSVLRSRTLISVLVARKHPVLILVQMLSFLASSRDSVCLAISWCGEQSPSVTAGPQNTWVPHSWSSCWWWDCTEGRSSSNKYVRKCPHADEILNSAVGVQGLIVHLSDQP